MEVTPAPEVDVDPGIRPALVKKVMRRQAALSLRVAAVFILLLLALPLLNLYAPAFAHQNVGGFSLTWLVLGVLFFPITWLLSAYFVRASESVEKVIVREHDEMIRAYPIEEPTR